jgi:uncharacterized protein
MKTSGTYGPVTGDLSRRARMRMSRPLFHAAWLRAVFLHYEVEPATLQPLVPFPLDLRQGMAYLSLVIFTLAELRTHSLPLIGRSLLRPVSDHYFLNARTYVKAGGAPGIYFLAEWLSRGIAVPLGRPLFGLPYHFGEFDCSHDPTHRCIAGNIVAAGRSVRYKAELAESTQPSPSAAGSLDEFLMERYTAFTKWCNLRRFFRVWHPPWPVTPLSATIEDNSLLRRTGDWITHARLVAAHYSPGLRDVWMGHPQILSETL